MTYTDLVKKSVTVLNNNPGAEQIRDLVTELQNAIDNPPSQRLVEENQDLDCKMSPS